MSTGVAKGEPFKCSRESLANLCQDEDPDIRLAARVVYRHRYGEEPP